MFISSKGRYALRVVVDIAERQTEDYIPLQEIADGQHLSEKYLEAIVKSLVSGGVLEGQRGKGGGYKLSRSPDQCTVGEILRLTEGELAPVSCVDKSVEQCERRYECRSYPMWQGLDKMISNYLDGFTIQDLMRNED